MLLMNKKLPKVFADRLSAYGVGMFHDPQVRSGGGSSTGFGLANGAGGLVGHVLEQFVLALGIPEIATFFFAQCVVAVFDIGFETKGNLPAWLGMGWFAVVVH